MMKSSPVTGTFTAIDEHGIVFFEFSIMHPIFWFPYPLGEPALYHANLNIYQLASNSDNSEEDQSNLIIYQKDFSFGVRKIIIDESERSDGGVHFHFLINDQPLFVMGTNWVPIDASHFPPLGRQVCTLEMVADLGCNMIRVWGGGIYPIDNDESFFNWCDAHGILVWQDFMMACG